MEDPGENGLVWEVIRREVDLAIPRLADFIQEAGNVGHSTQNKLSKNEAFLSIHKSAMHNFKTTDSHKFPDIFKQLEAANPHLAGHGGSLAAIVKTWSGGDNPMHLLEFGRFAKGIISRDVAGAEWNSFAKLLLATPAPSVLAFAKACLADSEQFAVREESKLMTSTDINSVAGTNSKSTAVADSVARMQVALECLTSSS